MEKPRYVVLAFQTDKKNALNKDCGSFDACDLQDLKVYLNSVYYPYENTRGDMCIFYDTFTRFQGPYYGGHSAPTISFETFKTKTTLYVVDCSKQNDTFKTGSVELRVEFKASKAFPADTSAYCLIIHRSKC